MGTPNYEVAVPALGTRRRGTGCARPEATSDVTADVIGSVACEAKQRHHDDPDGDRSSIGQA
jgi:hypothetical protein